ncbi:MAG: bifunctional 5,10-methylene-tetrahydrofolate dehydrogenase/5,10-methylene-tetrahydrofolate cyclohydrolase [Erysipelotrichaceae bacterium]|nr:bifunctional 5,10-methylene-tetrahydrofolate dehydrogenase/5,10-methylene-tetrahydrofolate cyclohydrolase [Erysipelotrichaceae bacterium]
MARILKGKPVADALMEVNRKEAEALKNKGLCPALAIFWVGEKDSDLAYEKGIISKAEEAGIRLVKNVFPEDVSVEEFLNKLSEADNDPDIHGILVFRPLPKRFDDDQIRNMIDPDKDVDGCNDLSLAGLFINKKLGHAPCTAQSVIELLKFYDINPAGKNVVVLGRSLVIGKPVSMMLLNMNATVTVCHSKTENIEAIASKADILICATGKMESVNRAYVNKDQTVIDVGISWNEKKQKLCGDVLFEEVEPLVKDITPVPGGVGSLTTSILINHVIESCKRSA